MNSKFEVDLGPPVHVCRYEVPPDALPDAPGTAFVEFESSMDALQRGTPLALCTCFLNLYKVEDPSVRRQPDFLVMPASSFRYR